MSLEDENFDPFEEDDVDTTSEDFTDEFEEEETEETKDEETEESTDETEETDEEDESDEDKSDEEEEASKEKMIPESRFKAALKDIQEKLDNVLQENAKLKAVDAPDREEDPEGYERHIRMEISKSFMRDMKTDYVEVIQHYQEMAKVNPHLNKMVEEHELPAKLAYDLAKRDMEIKEMVDARNSDEWKEFQEFKANKGKTETPKEDKTAADKLAEPTSKAAKLPKNLNRATEAKPKASEQLDDDGYLFGDSAIDNA